MKKIVLLLLAVLFAGVAACECQAAESAAEKKKSTRKSQRQKNRRAKKSKDVKHNKVAATIRQEIKEIHELQEKLLRNREDAEQAKKLVSMIQRNMKKNAALLKQLGKIQGLDMMSDLEKLVKEGKKLAPEGEEVTDATALELLQKKQLELIEKFRKGEK
ncbi:MAG: hypothetical protein E7048_06365 [Lentisphaerae bacterium]|nr:hypothetical protein [Lentisphaerota bacterium]